MALSDWLQKRMDEARDRARATVASLTAAPAPVAEPAGPVDPGKSYAERKLGGLVNPEKFEAPVPNKEKAAAAWSLAKELGQSFARSGALAANYIAAPLSGDSPTSTLDFSGGRIGRALFGDRPFSLESTGSETLAAFGAERLSKMPSVAVPVGGLLVGLDVFTGGGGSAARAAKAARALENVSDAATAAKVIERELPALSAAARESAAARAAATTDVGEIRRTLERAVAADMAKAAPRAQAGFDAAKYADEMTAATDEAIAGGPKPSLRQRAAARLEKLGADVVDSTLPITSRLERGLRAAKVTPLPQADIQYRIGNTLRARDIAESLIEQDGLGAAIERVGSMPAAEQRQFSQYLIARHTPYVAARGFETGRDLAKDEALVAALSDKFESLAAQVTDAANRLARRAEDAGLVAPGTVAHISELYPKYAPLNRAFGESERYALDQIAEGGRSVGSATAQTAIRKLEGSERAIVDPLASLADRYARVAYEIERNQVAGIIADSRNVPGNPLGVRALDTVDTIERRRGLIRSMAELADERADLKKVAARRKAEIATLQREIRDIAAKSQRAQAARELGEARALDAKAAAANRSAVETLKGKTPRTWDDVPDIPVQTADGKSVSLRNRLRAQFGDVTELSAAIRSEGLDAMAEAAGLPLRTIEKATEGIRGSAAFRGTFDPTAQPWFDELARAKSVDDFAESVVALAPERFRQLRTVAEGLSNKAASLRESAAARLSAARGVPGAAPLLPASAVARIVPRQIDRMTAMNDLARIQSRVDETVSLNRASRAELEELAKGELKSGEGVIKRYKNGALELYAVPKEIEIAAKSLDAQQVDGLSKVLTIIQNVNKFGITRGNPVFAIPNMLRDIQASAIAAPAFGLRRADTAASALLFRGIWAALRRDELYDAWRSTGGGTFYDAFRAGETGSKGVARGLAQRASRRALGTRASYVVRNPRELVTVIEDWVQKAEESVRIANFAGARRAAERMGFTGPDAVARAARVSREITTDFSRRGNQRWMNSVLLFFNAGVQGARQIARAAKGNPAGFARNVAVYLVAPAAVQTLWNLSDEKRAAAYRDISDHEKENNIVIVLPGAYKGDDGRWRGVFKIPLPQGYSKLHSAVRSEFERMAGEDGQTFGEAARKLVGVLSPINFSPEDVGSMVGSVPFFGTVAEQLGNRDFFRDRPIVTNEEISAPLQYDKSTSLWARAFGRAANWSPQRIQHVADKNLGGVGQIAGDYVDAAIYALGMAPEGAEAPDGGVLEKVSRRFASASGGQEERDAVARAREAVTAQEDVKVTARRAAEIEADRYEALGDDKAAKRTFLLDLADRDEALAEATADLIIERTKNFTASDKVMRNLDVANGARARFIVGEMRGMAREERRAYLLDLREKGLLPDSVADQIVALLAAEKAKGE